MGEHTKHSTSRVELRERIILAAVELFTTNGIKSITMDEIAASLGISKRTLYEVFPDKETLLEECILKSQKDGDIFVKGVIETSSNVLEVLLRCYLSLKCTNLSCSLSCAVSLRRRVPVSWRTLSANIARIR